MTDVPAEKAQWHVKKQSHESGQGGHAAFIAWDNTIIFFLTALLHKLDIAIMNNPIVWVEVMSVSSFVFTNVSFYKFVNTDYTNSSMADARMEVREQFFVCKKCIRWSYAV